MVVEIANAISRAFTAPRLSVKRTVITAERAAFEPMERSISPAMMQSVRARPTRPSTAKRSIMAKVVRWVAKNSFVKAKVAVDADGQQDGKGQIGVLGHPVF